MYIILGIFIVAVLVIRYYPHLGHRPSKEHVEVLKKSPQYGEGKFRNSIPTSSGLEGITRQDFFTMIRDTTIRRNPNRKPQKAIEMSEFQFSKMPLKDTNITWFGHSAMLLEINGKNILIDPMFGKSPTPFPQFSNGRYSVDLPFEIEELPQIDLVLLSHDHYDHLDYPTIMKIQEKVKHFIMPLGVGSHLQRWGIEKERIIEKDWWEESTIDGIQFVCTPARHFSGRNVNDSNKTLWASWVIKSEKVNIFFSGDSGYGPHFKEIGEKYGPFNIGLMECGQYDLRWKDIHMMPEETVQAAQDAKCDKMMPIHWGAFALALHDWTDPIDRVTKKAAQEQMNILTPKIGERMNIMDEKNPSFGWWLV